MFVNKSCDIEAMNEIMVNSLQVTSSLCWIYFVLDMLLVLPV